MRMIPSPHGKDRTRSGEGWLERANAAPPTVTGVATAGATLVLLGLTSLFLVVPSVFYLAPLPDNADGVTICVPGLGPLQRVREGLSGDQEELAFIHEGVHAEQCKTHGALWYARQTITARGRLMLEAQALCAEAALRSRRGADGQRLMDGTVAGLVSDYLEEGEVPGWEIAAAVNGACRDVVEIQASQDR